MLVIDVNWIGLYTLALKEIKRFLNVWLQTILAPVITNLLFFMVFSLSISERAAFNIDGVSYLTFLAPGLIMMTMAQNAFANPSSSFIVAKIQHSIRDLLSAPLSPAEIIWGYLAGALVRAAFIGFLSYFFINYIMMPIPTHYVGIILLFGFLGCLSMGLLGILGGILARKFDHLAAITNFIIMPMTFLSGTFYTIDRLPSFFQIVSHYNPFFHMINGFRYGFIAHSNVKLIFGAMILIIVNLILYVFCYYLFKTGYKLKE